MISIVSLAAICFIRFPISSEIPVSSHREEIYLIPSGKAVGMKLKTQGVMVVGVEQNGQLPAKKAGIKNGDIIENVNDVPCKTPAILKKC